MKKAVSLILALVMCLSLCACGEKSDNVKTKEELLAEAKTVNADEILNDIGGNKARAANYIDSVYCITGHVVECHEKRSGLYGYQKQNQANH